MAIGKIKKSANDEHADMSLFLFFRPVLVMQQKEPTKVKKQKKKRKNLASTLTKPTDKHKMIRAT